MEHHDTSNKRATAKVRVALIGAGHMACGVHYPSLQKFPDVERVALCDLNPLRLATAAQQPGRRRPYHALGGGAVSPSVEVTETQTLPVQSLLEPSPGNGH